MKPGSWCEKPLWSWRQTCELSRMLSEAIGAAPGDVPRGFQPFRVLVEHRVDDVDEGFVAGEQAVPAGQQVTLQPTLDIGAPTAPPSRGRRTQVGIPGDDLREPGRAW